MDWALGEIHNIQKAARSGRKPIVKPQWPVIILRTPKGMGAPKEIHGSPIEGSFHAHQVPLPKAKSDDEELKALQMWLQSYRINELLTGETQPIEEILSLIPKTPEKCLGQRPEAYKSYTPLDLPPWKSDDFTSAIETQESSMAAVGQYLAQVMKRSAVI